MNDNEIIKALENCGNVGECQKCSLNEMGYGISLCIPHLTQSALDLINRQKAELEKKDKLIEIADKMVESLKAEVKRLKFRKCLYSRLYSEHDTVLRDCTQGECFHSVSEEAVRLEAIKEFYEKFNSLLANFDDYDTLHIYEIKDRLDLVKEMVGDDNA